MNVLTELQRARSHLIIKQPFFGSLICSLELKEEQRLPMPCGTDARYIYYNPTMVDEVVKHALEVLRQSDMSENERSVSLKFGTLVMLHEILHVVFKHIWRKGKRCQKVWNIATDIAVNNAILDMNIQGIDEKLMKALGALYYVEWKGKTAEEIYELLPKEGGGGGGGGKGIGEWYGPGGGSSDGEDDNSDGGNSPENNENNDENDENEKDEGNENGDGRKKGRGQRHDTLDDHDMWKKSEKDKTLETEVDLRIKSTMHSLGRGSLPGNLQTLIDEYTQPIENWRDVLSRYLTIYPSDYSYCPPDRRFASSKHKFRLPSLSGEKLKAYVAIDNSGSISDDMLKDFLGELISIVRAFDQTEIFTIVNDAQKQEELDKTNIKVITKDTPTEEIVEWFSKTAGRCGTDFRPVFEYLEKEEDVAILVYMTDCDGTYPKDAPNFPVVWLCVDKDIDKRDYKPKFGEVIIYDRYN